MVHVTVHAVERALERIPGLEDEDEAVRLLSSQAVQRAADFTPTGTIYVKIGTGQHITVQDSYVVTVLPARLDMRRMSSEAELYRRARRAYDQSTRTRRSYHFTQGA